MASNWLSRLSRSGVQSGYTQSCVARGTVSWGTKDYDEAGELQLWYRERDNCYYLYASNTAGLDMAFSILPETTMKVTNDTVTISELRLGLSLLSGEGETVQLKDADPNELQLFIDKMPATIKAKMQDLRGANMQSPLPAGELQGQNEQRRPREIQQCEENSQRQLTETQRQQENLQRQLQEMQQREENSQRQLREMQQREENSQRQLTATQRQQENLRRQLQEMQQREENSQRNLRELRQREENAQRRLTETQRQQQNLQRQLHEMQQREENSQRNLRELRQREENSQRRLTEMQRREENSQRQLREMHQRLENYQQQVSTLERQLRGKDQEVNELELSLSLAQQTISEQRRQEICDWVISRNEIQMTENCLGRGGWGSVHEGTYCGCTVAVKQIHDLILSPHNRLLFEREMSIASACRHPCLLQFIGATNDEGTPLFVTELMEISLRALLAQRQLSETEITVISLDVARALNYLHQKKPHPIIHRDVSSANVLPWRQGDQWRGKVSDYGTANFMQQTITVAPGAMIYSSPEALTPNQTVKVDVYSYGVLLCEMCIRELPNPEKRDEQVLLMTSRVLRGLVRRCLQTDSEARPTMQEIIDELSGAV